MFKKIITLVFFIFSSFLISDKIEAINISYCQFQNEESLILPVTIGIDIEAIDRLYPMTELEKIYYHKEYFVYDKESCQNGISFPSIDLERYLPITEYYYKYNDKITMVNYPLTNGKYLEKDITSPEITSLSEEIILTVGKYTNLDNLTSYIRAIDNIDGYIYPEITYDGYSDNFNKIGTYHILFKACDTSGNCNSLQQKIKVIDNIPPLIEGDKNFVSYLSHPLSINDITLSLKATDNYDGDISDKIYIKNHNYDKFLPGNYVLYFLVYDNSNNLSENAFKVTVTVVDDISPIIEGPTSFISKLSSLLSTQTIISNLIVEDNIDKDAYKNLYIIVDNYSKNKYSLGTYSLVIGCYDDNENESLPYVIEITVIDDLLPTIQGDRIYESYISTPLTIKQILSNLIVLDNYDGNIVHKIEILSDTYSENKSKTGIYSISFIVKDSSNNCSEPFDVEIIIYDDILPIIEGNNFYKTLISEKIDVLSLLLSLSANDNIDGNISSKIELDEDSYSTNHNIPGTYFLSFYVVDSSGNISIPFKIKILVEEQLSILKSLNNSFIFLDTNIQKNDNEILEFLGIDTREFTNFITLENTYFNNYKVPGNYSIYYEFTNNDNTKELLKLNINVIETLQETTNIPQKTNNQKKETIFTKIISFFNSIFNKLFAWLKNLF